MCIPQILLWLDDCRNPHENDWLRFSPLKPLYTVIWVKSYSEFVDYITGNGLPTAICFDHDLGLDLAHSGIMSKRALKRFRKTIEYKTGYDCAKWLVNYCLDNNFKLPLWNVQSSNPVGKENIESILKSFEKFSENQ